MRFDTPIHTNDQGIARVLAAGLPVALVFVAGTPSPDLAESLIRLAGRHAGQLLLATVDTRENPIATRRYSIGTAPAVVTVKDGRTVAQAEAIDGSDLAQHIDYLLDKGPKPVPQTAASSTAAKLGNSMPVAVTDATFDREVLQANQPVLVDFWAPWCGPCRMVEPTLKKLAKEYGERLRVAKINVDESPALSNRYGVQGIPTMMIFRNGQIVDRWSGALPEPALRSRVRQTADV